MTLALSESKKVSSPDNYMYFGCLVFTMWATKYLKAESKVKPTLSSPDQLIASSQKYIFSISAMFDIVYNYRKYMRTGHWIVFQRPVRLMSSASG